MSPILKINEWLEREKELGSLNPDRIVLATSSKQGIPHSRVVAIKEITEESILFITQLGTRKVHDLNENPYASMTLWLPLQQREVILDGITQTLTHEENEHYWKSMSHEHQLRFFAYAPTTGQAIDSLDELEKKFNVLTARYNTQNVPLSEFYCGFRLIPKTLYFFTSSTNTFSEVIMYTKDRSTWKKQMLSP